MCETHASEEEPPTLWRFSWHLWFATPERVGITRSSPRRPKVKRVLLKTTHKRTADRALARLEEVHALGQFDPWAAKAPERPQGEREDLSRLRLRRAARAYLASCAHLKANTVRTYREVLQLFVAYVGEDSPVSRLSAGHVEAWLADLCTGDVTRHKYNKHLGYLFRHLVRAGYMEADLSKQARLRRVPERAPKAMTPEEVERLVEVMRSFIGRGFDGRVCSYTWLARLVEANVHLGLRRGELIHLRWDQIDFEARTLRVVNTDEFTTKSSKERTLPLCDRVLAVLREVYEGRCGPYVFHLGGESLKPGTLTRAFQRFRKRAGLPPHVNLHSTRHTFATWLAERGVPVGVIKELMGHSSITTTERYMRMRPATSRHWIEQAFASRSPGEPS